MPEAHSQTTTLHVVECFPAHEPRESDPHYGSFNAVRRHLEASGKLVCAVCGATEQIELHHSVIEFALANGIDPARFAARHPEYAGDVHDEDSLMAFVESDANLLPLCLKHHRGVEGIHCLPYPVWQNLGTERAGQADFGHLAEPA